MPDAALHAKLQAVLRSADLQFTDDGKRLLVLRHFSGKNEPVLSVHGVHSLRAADLLARGHELYKPLVGSDLFGKAELASELYGKLSRPFRSHGITVALNPNGRAFLTLSRQTTRLWDTAKGTPVGESCEHPGSVLGAFTKDGKRLLTMALIGGKGASGKAGYEIRIRDGNTNEPLGEPVTGTAEGVAGAYAVMISLAWAPDEKSFLTAYAVNQNAKSVQFWDAETKKPIGAPLPAEGDFHQFSSDGKSLLVISKKQMALWDIPGRKLISTLPTPEIFSLPIWQAHSLRQAVSERQWFAVHPEGTSVLYANQSRAELWDLSAEPPQKKKVLEHASGVGRVEISKDGKQAATSGLDEVFVWNLETGKRTLRIPRERQDGSIKAMKFSPDGQLLAIVNDRDVRVWSLQIKK